MYAVAEFPSKLLLFTEHSKEVSFSKMLSSSALRHWVVYLCHASLKRRHLGRLFHEMPGVLHFTSIHLVAKAPKCFAASRAAGYVDKNRIPCRKLRKSFEVVRCDARPERNRGSPFTRSNVIPANSRAVIAPLERDPSASIIDPISASARSDPRSRFHVRLRFLRSRPLES